MSKKTNSFHVLLDSTSENAMQVVQPLSVVNVGKPLGVVDHRKAENENIQNVKSPSSERKAKLICF